MANSALELLDLVQRADAELVVADDQLVLNLPDDAPVSTELVTRLRQQLVELHQLVAGTVCRWCNQPISQPRMTHPIALGDQTSLCQSCRYPFEADRKLRHRLRRLGIECRRDTASPA